RGIAAHHAGMLPLMKESVEHLFSRGLVKMVYATETLALGINMPARTVVIESLTKWNGSAHVSLSTGEYTQLSGRAGRRGIDTEGHAVVSHRGGVAPEEVAALASKRTYPLISAFTPTYNMVVNLLARSTRAQTRKVLESSFAQYQADSAVVALASRLTDLEAQRDATAEDLSCSHGDVREYLTLRDQLGQTEKSGARARKREARDESRRILSGVRPGDVLALTRGRKTRLCVVGAKATSASGRGEVSVIGEDATWRALAPEDVRGAIAVVGHMSIPGGSALRRTKERTRIAGELRSGAAKGIYVVPAESTQAFDPISALRVAMRQHPVHRCPHREEHARAGAQWARLEREINRLRSSIDSQTGSVAAQFDRVCAVLERLGFLAGDEVTDAGQRLRRIFGESDLVIAMSLDEGAWDGLDECELASMVSALVYDSRSEDDAQELAPSGVGTRLRTAWEECMGTLERVHRAEKRYGCDPTPGLDGALMAATLAWAHGSTLATAIEGAPIQPGDFVRWMRQVMDCLGQIASASDSSILARRAEGAKERIGRGIVAWSTI
ncbi:MAG: helicase-related protein, partial [Pauljensenia sp.]